MTYTKHPRLPRLRFLGANISPIVFGSPLVGVVPSRAYCRKLVTPSTQPTLLIMDTGLVDAIFSWKLETPTGFECIVTNPPFKLASEFIEHALSLVPRVVILARLALLESTRRNKILDGGHLARVHVFRRRLPFMHRDGYEGPKNSNSGMAFAWFVWDKAHTGPTELRRVSWEAA